MFPQKSPTFIKYLLKTHVNFYCFLISKEQHFPTSWDFFWTADKLQVEYFLQLTLWTHRTFTSNKNKTNMVEISKSVFG